MEKSSKLPPLPLVLSANLLREGTVVYYDGSGWVEKLTDATVARDEATARHLETIALGSAGVVASVDLVTVDVSEDGTIAAAHRREAIRASGPTVSFGEAA